MTTRRADDHSVYPFEPDNEYHTYRLEVWGDSLRMLVDGFLAAKAVVHEYEGLKRVDIWSDHYPMSIRTFRVLRVLHMQLLLQPHHRCPGPPEPDVGGCFVSINVPQDTETPSTPHIILPFQHTWCVRVQR